MEDVTVSKPLKQAFTRERTNTWRDGIPSFEYELVGLTFDDVKKMSQQEFEDYVSKATGATYKICTFYTLKRDGVKSLPWRRFIYKLRVLREIRREDLAEIDFLKKQKGE